MLGLHRVLAQKAKGLDASPCALLCAHRHRRTYGLRSRNLEFKLHQQWGWGKRSWGQHGQLQQLQRRRIIEQYRGRRDRRQRAYGVMFAGPIYHL